MRWRAADLYGDLPGVREDLDEWTAKLSAEFEGTDAHYDYYTRSEIDLVNRDLGELIGVVQKVGSRLAAVSEGLKGKRGNPGNIAQRTIFSRLQSVYERHTGNRTTISNYTDGEGSYRDGPWVNFVNSFITDCKKASIPMIGKAGVENQLAAFKRFRNRSTG